MVVLVHADPPGKIDHGPKTAGPEGFAGMTLSECVVVDSDSPTPPMMPNGSVMMIGSSATSSARETIISRKAGPPAPEPPGPPVDAVPR